MKKFICLMMVIMLILTIPTMVFATESDPTTTQAWVMRSTIREDANSQNYPQCAPNVTYDESTGRIIVAGQPTPLAKQYFDNIQKYKTAYPNVTCSITIVVDFQFNDQPWYSEYINKSMQASEIFQDTYTLQESENGEFVFSLCDVQKYTPELDINNVLNDIIEYRDDVPYIDFTKHTLRVKIKSVLTFESPEISLETEDVNDIVAVYHNTQMDVEAPLTALNIQKSIYNTHDNQLLITLEPSSAIDALLLAQHTLKLQIYSGTDENWTELPSILMQYKTTAYIVDTPTLQYSDEAPLYLKFCINDTTTTKTSDYNQCNIELKHTSGFDTDEEVLHISDNLCPLCKKCNTPANICMWIWISAGIALVISVISFTVFIIISIRKKQNTNKETAHA